MRKKIKEGDLTQSLAKKTKEVAGQMGLYDRGTEGIVAINEIGRAHV